MTQTPCNWKKRANGPPNSVDLAGGVEYARYQARDDQPVHRGNRDVERHGDYLPVNDHGSGMVSPAGQHERPVISRPGHFATAPQGVIVEALVTLIDVAPGRRVRGEHVGGLHT